ncbi:uncharacterized protein LOC122535115, partial [Frieseomelitta varia]|uniref:uncharacterized protein LOC122535115 n=1 Tax=Frieseomelitta varia TaxID=561572 RepID=UPI001CB6AD95
MVMASGSPSGSASSKLRRSRRLSSTRGLKVQPNVNEACSTEKTTRQDSCRSERASMNWELNERISLSSGSSPGLEVRPDARKGIELSGNRRKTETMDARRENNTGLELMNVSGFQQQRPGSRQRRDSWSIDVDVIERRAGGESVIKSDSKYEIGVPSGKQRRQLPGTVKSSKSTSARNDEMVEKEAAKWGGRKKKVDKTNDSISKRLELIHELNQKILANYERFQQRSRFKSQSKDAKDTKDTLSKSSGGTKKERKEGNEAHAVYAEAKRKGRTKLDGAVQDSSRQRRLDSNDKLTLSRGHCEKPAASKDQHGVDTLNEKRSTKTLPRSRVLRDNENFTMAPKPGFCESDESTRDRVLTTRIEYDGERRSDFCSTNDRQEMDSKWTHVDIVDDDATDCLGSSRLYPETGYSSNEARVDSTVTSKEPARRDRTESEIDLTDDRSRNKGDRVVDQTALEREILGTLDEAIERFDSARLDDEGGKKDEEEEEEKKKKKKKRDESNDNSMKSDGSMSELTSPKVARLQETFNSSWDSGVGVDVTGGSGWVRIHTGIESSLVYLTLDTTARDVCRDMLLGDDLSLFIQHGGEPGRRLATHEKPLEIQDQFLQKLGYQDVSRRSRLGVDPELRHLIAFHVGPASPLPELVGYSRCGYALVLKGLVFPQWKRRPLAVIGSRLFLYPACPESRPEWMELAGGGAVCYAPSRLGKLVLRITGFPRVTQQCHQSQQQEDSHHRETRHLYLGFHHPWDRDLWKSWIKQASRTIY